MFIRKIRVQIQSSMFRHILTFWKSKTFHRMLALFLAVNCTRSALSAIDERNLRLASAIVGYEWDLVGWEVNALREKAQALVKRPAAQLNRAESITLVRDYMQRAHKIGEDEDEINRILSESKEQSSAEQAAQINTLQSEIDRLRQQQADGRIAVEQVIEWQISQVITEAGLAWRGQPLPPVKFSFTEPPKKMVISPRDRISTVYGQMLDASISLEETEIAESQIYSRENLSAYITGIGGLGAYPSLVIDRASLSWVLSTVAHEWTHNYLTFFPLGVNYGANSEIIVINETVAEIVGDELGRRALLEFYPEDAPPETYPELRLKDDLLKPPVPRAFDFRREMRETRLTVDKLLEYARPPQCSPGECERRIRNAERYMQARRLLFVENGVNLRVLNQAYFAFHGSYGTSAASSDPIGPKIFKLRDVTGDLPAFLKAIRGVTTVEGLDEVLAEWEGK